MNKNNHFQDAMCLLIDREIFQKLDIRLSYDLSVIFDTLYHHYVNETSGTPFTEVKSRVANNNHEEFYDRIYSSVQGAIKSTLYSLQMFMAHTDFLKKQATKQFKYHSPQDVIIYPTDNKITYEFENFIIHSQILIDRLVWFFSYYFEIEDNMYLHVLYKKLKELRASNTRADKLIETIDKYKKILYGISLPIAEGEEKDKLRNIIAHRKELMIGTISVSIVKEEVQFHFYNQIVESEGFLEADKWLIQYYDDLMNAVIELITAFFNIRTSV
jgi:hypothetical protein